MTLLRSRLYNHCKLFLRGKGLRYPPDNSFPCAWLSAEFLGFFISFAQNFAGFA